MNPLRSSTFHIATLSLAPPLALAWTSITSPCMEIGFFWSASVTALAVSLYAFLNSDRTQGGMLLMYCLLACSLTLATTA